MEIPKGTPEWTCSGKWLQVWIYILRATIQFSSFLIENSGQFIFDNDNMWTNDDVQLNICQVQLETFMYSSPLCKMKKRYTLLFIVRWIWQDKL